MALDVYVGSLTRYYAGDWESVGERTARERGGQFDRPSRRLGRRAGSAADPPAVLAWRRVLSRSLAPHLASRSPGTKRWKRRWFTGRPGWDGFGSLVLWAAYAEHPALRRPASLPEEWDDDPALVRSNAEGFRSRYSHLVRNVELWLPSPSTSPSRARMSTAGASSSARRRRSAASSASSMRRPGRWMTARVDGAGAAAPGRGGAARSLRAARDGGDDWPGAAGGASTACR